MLISVLIYVYVIGGHVKLHGGWHLDSECVLVNTCSANLNIIMIVGV